MAGMIVNEMTDCLQQMAELQAKMEHLQEEKNNKAAEEVVKQNTTEPNLHIMSDWLNKYGEVIDEIERERVIVEQYNKFYNHHYTNSGKNVDISSKVQRYEFMLNMMYVLNDQDTSSQDRNYQYKQARSYGIYVTRDQDISQLLTDYEPTKEEYELYNNKELIKERYMSLQQKNNSEKIYKGGVTPRTQLLHNSPKFVSRGNNEPTYFMKQYIESTHNMFLIQQKKINELEKKIQEMSPKLLIQDNDCDAEDARRLYHNYQQIK